MTSESAGQALAAELWSEAISRSCRPVVRHLGGAPAPPRPAGSSPAPPLPRVKRTADTRTRATPRRERAKPKPHRSAGVSSVGSPRSTSRGGWWDGPMTAHHPNPRTVASAPDPSRCSTCGDDLHEQHQDRAKQTQSETGGHGYECNRVSVVRLARRTSALRYRRDAWSTLLLGCRSGRGDRRTCVRARVRQSDIREVRTERQVVGVHAPSVSGRDERPGPNRALECLQLDVDDVVDETATVREASVVACQHAEPVGAGTSAGSTC